MSYTDSIPGSQSEVNEFASLAPAFGFKEKAYKDRARNPAIVPVTWEKIPGDLVELNRWVEIRTRRNVDQERDAEWIRVPFRVHGTDPRPKANGDRNDLHADKSSPRTWGPIAGAKAAVRAMQNQEEYRRQQGRLAEIEAEVNHPAIRAGKIDDERALVVVDLDDVRHPDTGEVKAWALDVVKALDTYAEVSPTGTGLKAYAFGDPNVFKRTRKLTSPDGRKFDLLVEDFASMTGEHVPDAPRAVYDRTARLVALVNEFDPPKPKPKKPQATSTGLPLLNDDQAIEKIKAEAKDGEKWALAFGEEADVAAFKEAYGGDDSRADMALVGKVVFYAGPDVDRVERIMKRSSLVRPKWDEPRGDGSTWLRDEAEKFIAGEWNGQVYTGEKPGRAERPAADQWDVKEGSMFETKPVDWLVKNWIPFGKVTINEGDGEAGKSAVVCDLVARGATGRAMPCGTLHDPFPILWFQGEDDFGDTTKPRIEAAGGDARRVMVVEFDPTKPAPLTDPDRLERVIRKTGARFVVVEVMALALGVDNNKTDQVAKALAPVLKVAQATGAAIVCIRQLGKGGRRDVSLAGNGSVMISAMARSVLLVKAGVDGDRDLRAVGPTKGNLARDKTAHLFRLVNDPTFGVPVVKWEGPDRQSRTMKEIASDLLESDRRTVGRPVTQAHSAALAVCQPLIGRESTGRIIEEMENRAGVSRATAFRVLQAARQAEGTDGKEF